VQETLILVQTITQNFALMCCALYAVAATYVSLVERPAIAASGHYVASAYILFSQPRPTIFQTIFAAVGGISGILAGWASTNFWWLAGGIILLCAALFTLFVVAPESRDLRPAAPDADDAELNAKLVILSRLYAMQAIAGLAALFIYIMKT
jgi:hypothetical protein